MVDKLAGFIAKHPKTILVIATILLLPAAIGYISTFVNYDIMSYLPDSVESVQGEEILDKSFGLAANAFLVIEDTDSKDIVEIEDKIAEVDGVSSVTWVDKLVDTSIPVSILPDALTDIFYSTDKSGTMLMVQFSEGSASTTTMNAIKEIKTILNEKCFLSGMSAIVEDLKELADSEAPIYIAVAIVLALIALSFTMDSWVLPIVLLISLGYAIVYNMGTNFIMNGGISYITQMIAAILQLGVTMDYSVFLMDRFNEELTHNDNRSEAMQRAIKTTFLSLFNSSLTTVFGFLALCFMSFTLGFDIGIVMAKGVLLGVITVVIVLPAFLLMFYKPIYRFRHKRIIPSFNGLNKFLIKHRKVFSIIFLLLIIPSYIAQKSVDLDYCIENAMPEQLSSVQALYKLKNDFNMATTHFVIIDNDTPSGDVSSMISEFEDVDGVSNVISLNSYVGPSISEAILPDEIKDICIHDGYQLMMINSVYSTSTDECNAQIDELTSILKNYDPNGYITGEGVLSKDLISITDKDFKVTSIISIAAIFILIAISFKSISVPVLLVASIELAIFINEGVALFTGADVSFIAPTIISCVQLGATVDYAILLTTRFREELRNGKEKKEAMLTAANAADCSIFQSALVFFCATFGVYIVSNIEIVSSLCAMLARGAVISALVIILFLTPILCSCNSLINKTSIGWLNPDGHLFHKKEKKEMNKKNILRKATALTLSVVMLLSFAGCGKSAEETEDTATTAADSVQQVVYNTKATGVKKTETVYINMDNTGKTTEINVSDWIHADKGEVYVDDKSDLKDITNVKSEIEPVVSGDSLRWNMPTTDLYYSGTTTKQSPVNFEINYYLDGKKTDYKSIAGKSGEVKIEVTMKNNVYETVKIDGKEQKIYLPMLVVGGLIMDENNFSAISVENGRSVGDGSKEIVVMYGTPGMTQSLGLDDIDMGDLEGLVISETASVTATTDDFELGNMYFAAIPIASLNLGIEIPQTVDDLKSTLEIIEEVENTITEIDPDKLIESFITDPDNLDSITNIVTQAMELYSNNKVLIDMLSKYLTEDNIEDFRNVLALINNEDASKAIDFLTNTDIGKLITQLNSLSDAMPVLSAMNKDLQNEDVQKAIESLPETLSELAKIKSELQENQEFIDELSTLLSDENIETLTSLMSSLSDSGIAELGSKYAGMTGDLQGVVARCEKWLRFGRSYKVFTECGDDMETAITFIYQTPSIEVEKTVEATTGSSSQSPLQEFIAKFKK